MNHPPGELTFAITLARECRDIFRHFFGSVHTVWKEDNTPLTQADTDINNLIIRRITETYPGDAVYGEESSALTASDRVWAIDPIDGTQAFENGVPAATIVISLIEAGIPKLAVIYEPILDIMYTAARGQGAYRNDQRLVCADGDSFHARYAATSSHLPAGYATTGTVHDRISDADGKVFNFRSFAYCAAKVAEGRFVGAVLGIGRLYDIAAPALIVEEAGGVATDLKGDSLDFIKGSNGIVLSGKKLHQDFLDLIKL